MSVKGGGGVPPKSVTFFLAKILSVKGGGYPPYGQNPQSSIWPLPLVSSNILSSIFLSDFLPFFPRVTFSLSVYYHPMLASLWTPTTPRGCSLQFQYDVSGQPCSVLLNQPQHHQDVLDLQGEQCLPHLIFLSSSFRSANWDQRDWAREAIQVCLEGPLHPDYCLCCIVVRVGTNHWARGPFWKGVFFDWRHVSWARVWQRISSNVLSFW